MTAAPFDEATARSPHGNAVEVGEVGWGIVGYGWVARDYMAPGIRAAGHRLVAVADPGEASRAAAVAEGARAHADLAACIARCAG